MATPLHHDQPQQTLRVLQTLMSNPKKHADYPVNSESAAKKFQPNMPSVQPPQHAENPTNPRDSPYRRGAQQLPPRPPLSPTQMHHRQQQQYLRQRHPVEPSCTDPPEVVRPLEKPSPAWPHPVSSLKGSGLNRPKPDSPHVVSSVEGPGLHSREHTRHVKAKEQSSLQRHPIVSPREGHPHHVKQHSSLHPHQQKQVQNQSGPHGPHAEPSEAQNTTYAEKPASSSITNSHPRDYKAALTQQIHREQPHSQHALGQQPSLQHAMEDYFECKEDGRRQGQGQSSGLDHPKQTEKKQQHYLDFSRHAEEHPDICSGDHSHALCPLKGHVPHLAKEAKQHHQKQIDHHLEKQYYHHGDQIADQVIVDHETSDDNPHPESGATTPLRNDDSISPQQLHEYQPELSEASPEDSYFHVSKELVERDYQNECHLAASSTNQRSCGHVYDYSRAGVTLVEDSSKLANEQQLEKDQCRNEKGRLGQNSDNQECKEDSSYCEQPDTQNHPGISEEQLQDVESPPLFLGFNQNSTRFACGTSKGFRVFDVDTMSECFSSMVGGVALVELLFCTNTFLLVGGGPNPSFPPNKVVLWDGLKGAFCGERSQKFPILAVKVRQDRLVVVMENEVFIYNSNARLMFQVITISNPRGLCAISINEGPSVLACPGLKKGEIRIEHIGTNRGREEMPTRNSLVISAHDSGLACMSLTLDGSLLATASDRGTLIRVFNTQDGAPLKEVRRGMDRAEIFSIAFSSSSDWLAVSSDKGTIHVFGLRATGLRTNKTDDASSTIVVKNSGSTLSFIKGVLPKYFSSEWSAAQFKLPQEMKSVVAFGQEKHSILILGTDGSFFKCSFDPEHGGDMKQLTYSNFLKPREATA